MYTDRSGAKAAHTDCVSQEVSISGGPILAGSGNCTVEPARPTPEIAAVGNDLEESLYSLDKDISLLGQLITDLSIKISPVLRPAMLKETERATDGVSDTGRHVLTPLGEDLARCRAEVNYRRSHLHNLREFVQDIINRVEL